MKKSGYADSVLAAAESEGIQVPALWANEIANALAVAYRRQRITSADEQAFLFAHSLLDTEVEAPPSQ